MNPGLLTVASRSCEVPSEKLDAALVATASNFLSSGGTVTLTEWMWLPDEERRALYAASRALAVENAQTLAREILRGQLDPEALLGVAKAPEGAESK